MNRFRNAFKKMKSDGNLFKAMNLWAIGKILLVSLLSLTAILSILTSTDLENLDLTEENMFETLGTWRLILLFILLILFFFVAIGGMFQIFLYFQMLVDLNKRFQDTSSAFLRNIFRIELGKLLLNLIAYTQYKQTPGIFFCVVAASISGLNFVILINLKKWIVEDFLEPVKSEIDNSELASLNRAAQIWKIGLSITIILYFTRFYF